MRGKIQGGIWGQPWETKMEKEVEVIERRDEGGGGGPGVRHGGRRRRKENPSMLGHLMNSLFGACERILTGRCVSVAQRRIKGLVGCRQLR